MDLSICACASRAVSSCITSQAPKAMHNAGTRPVRCLAITFAATISWMFQLKAHVLHTNIKHHRSVRDSYLAETHTPSRYCQHVRPSDVISRVPVTSLLIDSVTSQFDTQCGVLANGSGRAPELPNLPRDCPRACNRRPRQPVHWRADCT